MTKEEKKDEMKNRISMALRDPILQQGFEIICKNLAELEKENEELRKNGFTVSAMTEQQLKVAIEKGEQLEKENKKVKQGCHKWFMRWRKVKREELEEISKIEELEKENDKLKDLVDMYNYFYSQAKELLEKWLKLHNTNTKKEIIADTEQFLKEIEK